MPNRYAHSNSADSGSEQIPFLRCSSQKWRSFTQTSTRAFRKAVPTGFELLAKIRPFACPSSFVWPVINSQTLQPRRGGTAVRFPSCCVHPSCGGSGACDGSRRDRSIRRGRSRRAAWPLPPRTCRSGSPEGAGGALIGAHLAVANQLLMSKFADLLIPRIALERRERSGLAETRRFPYLRHISYIKVDEVAKTLKAENGRACRRQPLIDPGLRPAAQRRTSSRRGTSRSHSRPLV